MRSSGFSTHVADRGVRYLRTTLENPQLVAAWTLHGDDRDTNARLVETYREMREKVAAARSGSSCSGARARLPTMRGSSATSRRSTST